MNLNFTSMTVGSRPGRSLLQKRTNARIKLQLSPETTSYTATQCLSPHVKKVPRLRRSFIWNLKNYSILNSNKYFEHVRVTCQCNTSPRNVVGTLAEGRGNWTSQNANPKSDKHIVWYYTPQIYQWQQLIYLASSSSAVNEGAPHDIVTLVLPWPRAKIEHWWDEKHLNDLSGSFSAFWLREQNRFVAAEFKHFANV